nr:histidine phosphatase family protein [Selenomonas caprae]
MPADRQRVPAGRKGRRHPAGIAGGRIGQGSAAPYQSLERARHTAEIVREAAGLDGAFLVEPDWQEIDFGRWEKRHYQDIAREEPAAWQSLCDDWQAFCYPQGESFRMFAERVIGAWQKWQQAAAREEKGLLVASHGGVLKVIRLFAEARPWEDFWQLDISLGEVQLMSLPVR